MVGLCGSYGAVTTATRQQIGDTYVDIAGPEALSLPETIFSTDGWPTTKHREDRASQSHLRVI